MPRGRVGHIVLGAALVLFALLALQVMLDGPLVRLDEQVTLWLAAHRQPGLTRVMLVVSDVHETGKLLAVAVVLAAWRLLRRDRVAVMGLAVVPAGELLNLLLKQVFHRVRPLAAEPLAHLSTYSFPSGHAVAATVFYGAVCMLVLLRARSRALRALAATAAVTMVLLVCLSRVYLGVHYLSDVLAGICAGTACVTLFFGWAQHNRPPVPLEG
jgi:membrane-associated phospholipid phosphatase